jgi:CheY-like chemotaxis protein
LGSDTSKTRGRVLIIDDEPAVATSLSRVLRGHDVSIATSGPVALEQLSEGFDLVLCDLMMPGQSGMDLYEEVRRRHPGLEERFVFITGGTISEKSQDFIASIPNRCLRKPFEPSLLRELLRERLRVRSTAF